MAKAAAKACLPLGIRLRCLSRHRARRDRSAGCNPLFSSWRCLLAGSPAAGTGGRQHQNLLPAALSKLLTISNPSTERSPSNWPDSDRVERAIKKLKSLHDGDRGLIETVACGRRAISALRALLFEREPIGLFQVRCLAARALAGLEAYDVLIEFLEAPRDPSFASSRMHFR